MSKFSQAQRRSNLAVALPSNPMLALYIDDQDEDGSPQIYWEAPSWPPLDYTIERRTNGGAWGVMATINPPEVYWTDWSVTRGGGTLYEYRVKPRWLDGEAPWSNIDEVYGEPIE